MNRAQVFYITFVYDSIDFDLTQTGFSLDDIVIYVPQEKVVKIPNGKLILNENYGCSVHADIVVGEFIWKPEEKKIEFEGEVNFVWTDSDSGSPNTLIDEEEVIEIIRCGEASCIVPYTQERVIPGLKVKDLFINIDLDEHLSVDVLYSDTLVEEIDIEQYDTDGELYFNE